MPLDESIVNSLPEDIRSEPTFAELQKGDLPSAFKQMIDTQKTLGRAVILPDEKDDDARRTEKLNAVYNKLGRPESHDKYDFKDVIGDGVDQEKLSKWTKTFHDAGLSNAQATKLLQTFKEDVSSDLTIETLTAALRDGEGGWGDKFDENLSIAKRAIAATGEVGASMLEFLEETRAGNDPRVVKFLHAIGSTMAEDKTPPRKDGPAGALDKSSAQSKASAIMNDKAHPYWHRGMPGHQEALEEMKKLNEVIHGVATVVTLGDK